MSRIVITLSVPAIILFCLASSCALLSGFLLLQEIAEINRKLPESEQISYWGMHPMKMAKIRREYKRLYPSGRLDLMGRIFQLAMVVFAVLFAVALGFFW